MPEIVGRQGDIVVVKRDDGSTARVPGAVAARLGVDPNALPDLDAQADESSLAPLSLPPPGAQDGPAVSPFAGALQSPFAPPQATPPSDIGAPPTLGGAELQAPTLAPPPVTPMEQPGIPAPLVRSSPRTGYKDVDRTISESMGVQQGAANQQMQALQQQQAAIRSVDPYMRDAQAAVLEEQKAIEEQQKRQAEIYSDAQKEMGDIQTEIDRVSAAEPDQGRWWQSRDSFQKAAAFVGVLIQGFLRPGEENVALRGIMNEIDKDVAIQEKTLDKKLGALRDRRALMGQKIDWETERTKALLAARTAKVGAVMKMLDIAKAQSTNDQQIAVIEAAKGQLAGHVADQAMDAAFRVGQIRMNREEIYGRLAAARAAAAGSGQTVQPSMENVITDPNTGTPIVLGQTQDGTPIYLQALPSEKGKLAVEARTALGGYANFRDKLKRYAELLSIMNQPGEGWTKRFLKTAEGAEFDSLKRDLAFSWARMANEDGKISDADVANGYKVLGEPSLLGMSRKEVTNRLLSTAKAEAHRYLGVRGVRVDLFDIDSVKPFSGGRPGGENPPSFRGGVGTEGRVARPPAPDGLQEGPVPSGVPPALRRPPPGPYDGAPQDSKMNDLTKEYFDRRSGR